jgi:hypothetical protein
MLPVVVVRSPDLLDRPPAEVEQMVPASGTEDGNGPLALLVAVDRYVHDSAV